MSIAFQQIVFLPGTEPGTSATGNITVSAGGLVVVTLNTTFFGLIGTVTCVDDLSNNYTLIGNVNDGAQVASAMLFFRYPSGGTRTLTVSWTNSDFFTCNALEYSGTAAVSPSDAFSSNHGNTNATLNIDAGTVVVTAPNDLVVASYSMSSVSAITPGAGFNPRYNDNANVLIQDIIASSNKATPATTNVPATHFAGISASFKASVLATVFKKSLSQYGTRTGSRQPIGAGH